MNKSAKVVLSGQPGRTDVGPGWPQLGVCNARSSLGVSNAFTVVQKIDAALRGAAILRWPAARITLRQGFRVVHDTG